MIDALVDLRDAIVACLVGMLALSIAPVLLGWTTTVVMSGSMAPGIRPGDVIVSAPADVPTQVKPGRIVLVEDPARPGELLMHRLVRYDGGAMVLKGDANLAPDSTLVPQSALRGLPRLRVPMIGLPYLWVRQSQFGPAAAAALLLVALLAWHPASPAADRPAPRRSRDSPAQP